MKTCILLSLNFVILLFNFSQTQAQTQEIDSLFSVVNNTENDSLKIALYNSLARKFYRNAPEKTDSLAAIAEQISIKTGAKDMEAVSLKKRGIAHYYMGKYHEAITLYMKSLQYFQANDSLRDMASLYNNIGMIYWRQNDQEHALENFSEALQYMRSIGNKRGEATCVMNVGTILAKKGMVDSSNVCFQRSIDLNTELGNFQGVAGAYTNIGINFYDKKEWSVANNWFLLAKDLYLEIEDNYTLCNTYINLARIQFHTKNYKKALYLIDSAEVYVKKAKTLEFEKDIHLDRSEIYYALGLVEKAYKEHLKYSELSDSLFTKDNKEALAGMEAQFNTEKKEHENKILKQDARLNEAELRRKTTVNLALRGVIAIVIIFLVILFRNFKTIKKKKNKLSILYNEMSQQKEEIEAQSEQLEFQRDKLEAMHEEELRQKEALEETHKKIGSSIDYAQRIQRALLTQESKINSFFGENHFILYQPKDKVSGDFYFFRKIRETIVIAIADCTGHGIPGAFMSMLGISLLDRIIKRAEVETAAEVLEDLRQAVKSLLQQTGKYGEQQDGMDIGVVGFNPTTRELQFAGANVPLHIFHGGTHKEIKPDKQPISIYPKEKPFTNHQLVLEPDSCIYLFSDGYKSQFGGKFGLPYGNKQLIDALKQVHTKPFPTQKKTLYTDLMQWKQDSPQIDDIMVFGAKL